MRIATVQFAPQFGDVSGNLGTIERLIASAEADLYVLPELCTTGYQFTSPRELADLAEPAQGGPTVERLAKMAAQHRACLVAGFAEAAAGAFYNSAVLVGPAGYLGHYRKVHLFREEKVWFTGGRGPFAVHDLGSCRLAIMICFDWIFPETARSLALQGAQIIAHCSNLVLPHGQAAAITRALENRVFIALANRVGTECRGGREALTFTGASVIVSPHGEELARAPREQEAVQVVEINPADADDKHITPENDVFADRRPELYGALAGLFSK